jgi:hypothetical protein
MQADGFFPKRGKILLWKNEKALYKLHLCVVYFKSWSMRGAMGGCIGA